MKNEHIGWVDLLRIIACFLVVVSHSCDPFVGIFDMDSPEFLTGALLGSLVRPCVPLFVMMSGVLLLPVNMDMATFYKKRARRLLVPFVCWSLMLPVLYYLYFNVAGVETVSPNIDPEGFTWEMTVRKMYTFLFNFNYDTTPLWYLYMLVGLYLFMPVINPWLVQAKKSEFHWFLGFWLFSLCLPYIQMVAPALGYMGNYGHMGLLGTCDWNVYGTFYYFSGFLGYLVLAYYLVRYPLDWSWGRTLGVAIPLFIIGYAVTAGGFLVTQTYYPGSYAELEVFWYFAGINVFAMTVPVFVIIQKIPIKPSARMQKTAALTFGIYLCHFVVVQLGYDLVYTHVQAPAIIKILLVAVIAFTLSLLAIWLLSLNNVTKRFVM